MFTECWQLHSQPVYGGKVGTVTDCRVRGLGFLLQEQKPVRYQEWSGMVETYARYG